MSANESSFLKSFAKSISQPKTLAKLMICFSFNPAVMPAFQKLELIVPDAYCVRFSMSFFIDTRAYLMVTIKLNYKCFGAANSIIYLI
jgi:hypothetical protein